MKTDGFQLVLKSESKGRLQSGFTMIEIVVSSITLMLFFAALVVIFENVIDLAGESRVRTVATALGAEKLEEVRNMSYDDVGTQGGIPSGTIPQDEVVNINGQDFNVNTTVVYVDDPFDGEAPDDVIPTDYKRIRIAVSWGGAFASKNPVVMVTDAAPDGLEMAEGGGTLIVYVINASGIPVSGATVSVYNTDVDPDIDLEITTNSSGRVVLPGSPDCIDCYQISVNKTGYSSDRTYSTSEVTNPLKPHATVIEGEVTQLTLAIDGLASMNVNVTGSREANYPPFQGVEFTLRGAKTIGTNALDEPVYKYEQNHVSGFGGIINISNLEWDTYEVFLPSGSSVDLAGSTPISPFSLIPGQNTGFNLVTSASTPNSLLTIVTDISEVPIASGSIELSGSGYLATKSAGLASQGDFGQAFFSGLNPGVYSLRINIPGYLEATSSANISGDEIEHLYLESE